MPRLEAIHANPQDLADNGPSLPVHIGFDPNRFGPQTADEPFSGTHLALFDTGASTNFVDIALAQQLALPHRGYWPVAGAAGRQIHPVFLAHVYIPALQKSISEPFIGIILHSGHFPQSVVIGRSTLRDYIMTYDGINGSVSFEWKPR